MDEIETMIEDCLNRKHKMIEWEQGFMCSIKNQYNKRHRLTIAQEEKLNEIWERVT